MSDWIRNENVEVSFKDLHGVKPEVYFFSPVTRGVNKVKISSKGKDIFITETLERGLTKEALLEYNGEITSFKRVFDAEKKAVEILGE